MQDLSLQLEKRTPKNYQIPPKNYPQIVFPLNFVGSYPISLSLKFAANPFARTNLIVTRA